MAQLRSSMISALVAAAVGLAACSSSDEAEPLPQQASIALPSAVATTGAPSTTAPALSSTTPAPSTTTPAAPTSAPTTSTPSGSAPLVELELGRSVQGRPITAMMRGTPGGVKVLVIGVIHGNEDAGLAIVDELAVVEVPEGVELWLLPALNPDGVALGQRGNANLVDLNRNFPHDWGPIGAPGDPQYAGTGPASEPETQAAVAFLSWLRPDLTIWYHQDLNRIAPGSGLDGLVRQRYAELTGLPVAAITGGTYTGVAATWHRRTVGGVSFIVELGPTLTREQAAVHAAAVLAVADLVR